MYVTSFQRKIIEKLIELDDGVEIYQVLQNVFSDILNEFKLNMYFTNIPVPYVYINYNSNIKPDLISKYEWACFRYKQSIIAKKESKFPDTSLYDGDIISAWNFSKTFSTLIREEEQVVKLMKFAFSKIYEVNELLLVLEKNFILRTTSQSLQAYDLGMRKEFITNPRVVSSSEITPESLEQLIHFFSTFNILESKKNLIKFRKGYLTKEEIDKKGNIRRINTSLGISILSVIFSAFAVSIAAFVAFSPSPSDYQNSQTAPNQIPIYSSQQVPIKQETLTKLYPYH